MAFREREAFRVFGLREQLFSPLACQSLLEDKIHLGPGYESENLHSSIRDTATTFFKERGIHWHGNTSCDASIVSSQVSCLNCLFPFTRDEPALRRWLSLLYPGLSEVLPISSRREPCLENGCRPFVTFEWIGERNYLGERVWGTRGAKCTNVDLIFRFRNSQNKIHLVLGEWKYCESYFSKKDYIRKSRKGTDRVAIYQPHCRLDGCQIVLDTVKFEDLFFEPLDQLMRLQLLASAMEREHEMDADIVSVLHIAPRANNDLLSRTLSSKVGAGSTVGDVWRSVTKQGRFQSVALEDLIPMLESSRGDRAWAQYIERRYASIVTAKNDGSRLG